MSERWERNADRVLNELQEKVSARDLPALLGFFEDPAVLIGTAGDGRTPEDRRQYLTAVVTQRAALSWDWRETVLFYETDTALGFSAFGEVVLTNESEEWRAPIRASLLAVQGTEGWRLRHFHGSIAQSPS